MIAAPTLIPVTLPEPSVCTMVVLLLLHVPPTVLSLSVIVVPGQITVAPFTGNGPASTLVVYTLELAVVVVMQLPFAVIVQVIRLPLVSELLE